MKLPAFLALLATPLAAQSNAGTPPILPSAAYDWEKLAVAKTANGERRAVFDGPSATVDKIHCHITTLDVGKASGEPSYHRQEEVIIIREGKIEAWFDGKTQTVGPGSVLYFAAGATTRLKNVGDTPATYTVIYYYTPLTPKG